jgi:hypothetical protein
MGRISNIEEKLAAIIERPFRMNNTLDPLNIEITIKRLAEQQKKNILGQIVIPNAYSVVIDESIFNEYAPFFDSLRDSMQKSINIWIKEKGYETVHNITFQFKKGSLDNTSFGVFAYYSNGNNHNSSSSTPPPFNPSPTLQEKEYGEGLSVTLERIGGSPQELIDMTTGEVFGICEGETIIGRSKDCDITIQDLTVSEIHAYIYIIFGKCILEDLGSKNGTRVNHVKINKKTLNHGDRIIIGNTELHFMHKPSL